MKQKKNKNFGIVKFHRKTIYRKTRFARVTYSERNLSWDYKKEINKTVMTFSDCNCRVLCRTRTTKSNLYNPKFFDVLPGLDMFIDTSFATTFGPKSQAASVSPNFAGDKVLKFCNPLSKVFLIKHKFLIPNVMRNSDTCG